MNKLPNDKMILRPAKRFIMLNFFLIIISTYAVIALIIFLLLPEALIFFLILMCIAIIIMTPSYLIVQSRIKYVISNETLCIYQNNGDSIIYPMSQLVILNEEKIRLRKPKISDIIVSAKTVDINRKSSIMDFVPAYALAKSLDKKVKKRRLFGIKNPELICDLLNNLSKNAKELVK